MPASAADFSEWEEWEEWEGWRSLASFALADLWRQPQPEASSSAHSAARRRSIVTEVLAGLSVAATNGYCHERRCSTRFQASESVSDAGTAAASSTASYSGGAIKSASS